MCGARFEGCGKMTCAKHSQVLEVVRIGEDFTAEFCVNCVSLFEHERLSYTDDDFPMPTPVTFTYSFTYGYSF